MVIFRPTHIAQKEATALSKGPGALPVVPSVAPPLVSPVVPPASLVVPPVAPSAVVTPVAPVAPVAPASAPSAALCPVPPISTSRCTNPFGCFTPFKRYEHF